jgi:DNA adenine methylase
MGDFRQCRFDQKRAIRKQILHKNGNLTARCNTGAGSSLSPFLKWAGGKRWLVARHSSIFPSKYNRYFEPFLGSAAVFFYFRPENAVLSDANTSLIDTYRALVDDWSAVQAKLEIHHLKHSKDYYYEQRSRRLRNVASKAAQFIYLNRTCWNGLYRVNLKGKFNVPIGTKDSVLFADDDFNAVSCLLSNATLLAQDFEPTINLATTGDLLYVDPPYTVNHNLNGFLKYNETIFSWDDQLRLHAALLRARSRGVQIVVSNANHTSIRKLYKGFGSCHEVKRQSVLASDSNKRGPTTELLITANLVSHVV